MYGRQGNLTTLHLSNLRYVSPEAPPSFLSAQPSLEVLHINVNNHAATEPAALMLTDGALSRLRKAKASRDVVCAILVCPSPNEERQPLEVIIGFKLSGDNSNNSQTEPPPPASSKSISDTTFLSCLRQCGFSIRRIELSGWHDMEHIRKLAVCVCS